MTPTTTGPPAPGAGPPAGPAAGPLAALAPGADADAVFEAFTGWVSAQGIDPYPAQLEALLEIATGAHVVLSTPTGSGKSLVALGAHVAALAAGRRSVYTAPVKALVSEKFFALVETLGAENVGMVTGDASVNPDAAVLCCTAEILANLALRHGTETGLDVVVMDEFHYYGDPERGWAWQVPLLEMTGAQFLLMSATLGDVTAVTADLARRTGRPAALVSSAERPVPLRFDYVLTPLHETLAELLATHQAPVYVVHSTQEAAVERASALMSSNVSTRAEKDEIAAVIGGFRFSTKFGQTLSRLVRHGIGVHHAGMLPKYRRLVELLAQVGLLKVVCGTDTLGVGINLPIRTVVFTSLSKYDGVSTRHLRAREFHQIAGRAGRAGFDTSGLVVVQAPEHVIDNERALAKVGDDPRKRRSVRRKTPPEGFVSWDAKTFERLVGASPETLRPQLRVNHALLLNVVARPGDFFAHMRRLLLDNHQPRASQRALVRQAIRLFRALLTAGVLERLPTPDDEGRTVRLTADLQTGFALNQPLSAFALAALELLDAASTTYALDVVSVVEATLDDPRQVLAAQRSKARGEAVAAMKAEGIDYEERVELVAEVTWPRPLAELLESSLEVYARAHPWVADARLSPKSVVRDLWERAMTFAEFTGFYSLARVEGLVLRYVADAYRALRQTVPDDAKTDDLRDLTAWLGELVRQVDSSLLEEWERLREPVEPAGSSVATAAVEPPPPPVTANARAFLVLVRNALFRRVELAALRRTADLGDLDAASGWDAAAWDTALASYFAEHDRIGTDAPARGPLLFQVTEEPERWLVRQVLADPAGDHDWAISAEVDLRASDAAGQAVLRVTGVGAM